MTIIAPTHRLIYVHLRKCGGSSVEAAYQPHARWCDLVIGSTKEGEALQTIYRKLHGIHKHSTARELKGKLPEIWEPYWKITTVRNPFGVYESFYRWITKIVAHYADVSGISLADAKAGILDRSVDRPFVGWDVTRPFALSVDFAEFVERLLQDRRPSLFDQLSDGDALIVDRVFRLEEIGKLWKALSGRLGTTIEAKHANRGARKLETRWSPAAIAAVQDQHARDFEAFGYPFEIDRR